MRPTKDFSGQKYRKAPVQHPPSWALKEGDRVFVLQDHPWAGRAGVLIAYEMYGLGWHGWRVKLDGNCGECYANIDQLQRA